MYDCNKQLDSIYKEKFTSHSVGEDVSICQPVFINLPTAHNLGVTFAGCKHKCRCPDSESGKEAQMWNSQGRRQKTLPNVWMNTASCLGVKELLISTLLLHFRSCFQLVPVVLRTLVEIISFEAPDEIKCGNKNAN